MPVACGFREITALSCASVFPSGAVIHRRFHWACVPGVSRRPCRGYMVQPWAGLAHWSRDLRAASPAHHDRPSGVPRATLRQGYAGTCHRPAGRPRGRSVGRQDRSPLPVDHRRRRASGGSLRRLAGEAGDSRAVSRLVKINFDETSRSPPRTCSSSLTTKQTAFPTKLTGARREGFESPTFSDP